MNIIEIRDQDLPDDLQAIASEAARIVRRGIRQAAAHLGDKTAFPLPAAAGTVEQAALRLLKEASTRNVRRVRIFTAKSAAHLRTPAPAQPAAPVLSGLNANTGLISNGLLATLRSTNQAAKALPLAAGTVTALKAAAASGDLNALGRALDLGASIPAGGTAAAAAPSTASVPPGFTKLRINLHRVKCLDDIGLELTDFAEDDIRLGGLGTDSTGQSVKMQAFKVGDFGRGEIARFRPERKLMEFDLTRQGTWPRAFGSTLLMAESDGSGAILEALRDLWDATGEIVEELVVSAALAAGAAAGITAGAAGGPVGMLVGAVVGAALGLLIQFLFEALEDDIFDPVTVTLLLPNASSRFAGNSLRSGQRSEQFVHRSGRYLVKYEWKLVA